MAFNQQFGGQNFGGTSLSDLFNQIRPLPPQSVPFSKVKQVPFKGGVGNTPPILPGGGQQIQPLPPEGNNTIQPFGGGQSNLFSFLQKLLSGGGQQTQPFIPPPSPNGQGTPLSSLTGINSPQDIQLSNPFGSLLNQGFVR